MIGTIKKTKRMQSAGAPLGWYGIGYEVSYNLCRTGEGSWDTLQLNMVLYRPRVSGSEQHTPNLNFIGYPCQDFSHKI